MSQKTPPDSGGPPRAGASPASNIPARIGRYQVIERVGRSGMSILYRGIDPVLDREVAIKVMIGDFGDDLHVLRPRLQGEARAAGRLQHRNIVTIFDVAEEEGTPYIVMEYLRGASLSVRAKAEPRLTMDEKLEIVAQLCDGLGYAHEQGIIHRDVKPSNIFLLTDGTVKLLDFGLARVTSSTWRSDMLGNSSYMSPEQIVGDTVDGRSDVFSAGAVLFELLAGRRPFDDDTATTTVMKTLKTEAPSLDALDSTIPGPLADVVARALQRDPAKRFQTASEFARALQSLRRGVPGEVAVTVSRSIGADTARPNTAAAATAPRSSESAIDTGAIRVRVPRSSATSSLLAWLKRHLTFQKHKRSAYLPKNTVVDDVHFTLTSPARLRRETSTEVIFWCHLDRERLSVILRAIHALRLRQDDLATKSEGPFEVARGSVLTVGLHIDGLTVEPSAKTVLWKGRTGNATFVVTTPADCALDQHRGHASVRIDGTEIARLDFVLTVGEAPSMRRTQHRTVTRHRKAFASYATEDRVEVLKRIQGIQKAVPTLDVFVDVLKLRSGEDWQQEIRRRIPQSDVFYLFWSRRAKLSQWVDTEWRLAFERKGLDFIDPVPLEPARIAPPPPELSAKHFDDPLIGYLHRE